MSGKRCLSLIVALVLVISSIQLMNYENVEAKTKKYVKSLKVNKKNVTIKKGSSKNIKVTVKTKGKANKNFTVKVNNKKIVKVVKKKGKIIIKAKKVGKTKITIRTKGKNKKGKRLKKTIKVTVKKKVSNSNTTNSNLNNTTKPEDNSTTEEKVKISEVIIDNPDIEIGKETNIILTGKIESSDEESYAVVDEKNNVVGYIYDDGIGEDEMAGDGEYIGNLSMYSETMYEAKLYILINGEKSEEYASVYFYKPLTDEDNDEYNEFVDGMDLIVEEYDDKTEQSAKQLYYNIIDYVEENKSYGVVETYNLINDTIEIKLTSGFTIIYEFPIYEESKGSESEIQTYSSTTLANSLENYSKPVATFEPYSDLKNPYFDYAAQSVANSKYDYTFQGNFDGTSVSIEKMKHLNDYSIVIWCGHGGYSSELGPLVFSGTKISDVNNEKYSADILYGRIVNNYSGGQYGVSAEFFERYYQKNDFNDTLIYFGTCHSADDERLTNVLIDKGVATILGYKNSVSSTYDEKMVQTVFEELSLDKSSPVTVAQALSTAKNIHGKNDEEKNKSWWDWLLALWQDDDPPAELCIKGNKNYTLAIDNTPSTSISTKYDIVLTWAADPCDMDAHMKGYIPYPTSTYFHVYYNDEEAYDYYGNIICALDDDDVSGYGPETITVDVTSNGIYDYYVHKFDGNGSVNTSQSVVKVYQDGVLKHTYNVSENSGEGDYWNVFSIENGVFIEKNTITDEPEESF